MGKIQETAGERAAEECVCICVLVWPHNLVVGEVGDPACLSASIASSLSISLSISLSMSACISSSISSASWSYPDKSSLSAEDRKIVA